MAQIFGADIAAVGVGDPAEVISGIDARDVPGTVTNVAAEFDPNTRSVIARVAADNPGDLLKKQMYVRVLIHSRHASEGSWRRYPRSCATTIICRSCMSPNRTADLGAGTSHSGTVQAMRTTSPTDCGPATGS